MFKNMKLGTKLILGFLTIAVIATIVGGVGYSGLSTTKAGIEDIGLDKLPSVKSLLIINEAQTAVRSAERMLFNPQTALEDRREQYQLLERYWKNANDAWSVYEPLPRSAEGERIWKEFVAAWNTWKSAHLQRLQLVHEKDRLVEQGEEQNRVCITEIDNRLFEMANAGRPLFRAVEAALDQLTELNATQADTATQVACAAATRSSFIMITSLIIGIVTSIVLGIVITRAITKPINQIIAGLTEGAQQVAAASGQVSAASQSLAEGATEQAAGLEETSSSLEEMSSMTKQNADNAQQANTLAAEARKAAQGGAESMQRMSRAIDDIQKSSDQTAKIIKVIDEIAFQTNLLALNAAVEAARAGEAGKGFAVVAEEVRNLAMRSAEAAKNTANMIEESVKNARNGVDISNEVSKALEEIVAGIAKTTDLVGEIAAASSEQAQGIDQVNTAVAQMDKVTQQNAANAEESASASEELSAQAEQMQGIVEELVGLVEGASAAQDRIRKAPRRTSKPVGAKPKLNLADHTFHEIADGKKAAKKAPAATGHKALPLESAEFQEFNG